MASFETHLDLYQKFRKDAKNAALYKGTRAEVYFLSAYHLIDACAAMEHIHINKHQKVRSTLEYNQFIFKEKTEEVWRAFQAIENQLRPKFAYSYSWAEDDFIKIGLNFTIIEKICLEILKDVSGVPTIT